MKVTVIGAGLAGCEAAYQLTRFNIPVKLIDMKPESKSPAHKSKDFAELVCSNSLKAKRVENASGLLKKEMETIGSLIIEAALQTSIPAGGALAVDRECFAGYITGKILENPLIETQCETVETIPDSECVIIATGPLTQGKLFENIRSIIGSSEMSFFDAAAPVLLSESVNMNIAFRQSRYGKGADDYINCPMNEFEYNRFYDELLKADLVPFHDFEDKKIFEGCMPVEAMAKRGRDTMRFGPLKPVGLTDPATGKMPYACVQLRQDNKSATLYNMVGFQTRLTFREQKRIFSMIPGLEKAEFMRYGVMHRNTFINSPGILSAAYECKKIPGLFFAGQITGVEGYVESASSGMIAGINAALFAMGSKERFILPGTTLTGALSGYISDSEIKKFQPMNSNFGIVDSLDKKIRKKDERYRELAIRSLDVIKEKISELGI